MIDPTTAAAAYGLATALGLNPEELIKGAVDWAAYNWFGVGRCSSENRQAKWRQARMLDDSTLSDLINGRVPWSNFSKGDCGKWFQSYALAEAMRRFEEQQAIERQYGQGVLVQPDPFDADWFRRSLLEGGVNLDPTRAPIVERGRDRLNDPSSPLFQQLLERTALAQAQLREQYRMPSPGLQLPRAPGAARLRAQDKAVVGFTLAGLALAGLTVLAKKGRGKAKGKRR